METSAKKPGKLTKEQMLRIARDKADGGEDFDTALRLLREGNRNGRRSKRLLTFKQAQEIRRLKANGATYDQLSEKFGLDRCPLYRIVKGQTYAIP